MLNIIIKIFKIFNIDVSIKSVSKTRNEYTKINAELFKNDDLINSISDSLVHSIISNDFVAIPAAIIVELEQKYNLTVNQFNILLIKLGMLIEMYVSNPTELLQRAKKIVDSKESIELFNKMLKQQEANEKAKLKEDYDKLIKEELAADIATGKVSDPDSLIDNWLNNKDKN